MTGRFAKGKATQALPTGLCREIDSRWALLDRQDSILPPDQFLESKRRVLMPARLVSEPCSFWSMATWT